MIRTAATSQKKPNDTRLLDAREVQAMLQSAVRWPGDLRPTDVAVERCWPARDGGLVFEWSFALGNRGRRTLFGKTGPKVCEERQPPLLEARDTAAGLRSVRVHAPQYGALIHSPDCDSAMPHLAACLDPEEMADRLRRMWPWLNECHPASSGRVDCRLLGYRPARRATIAYRTKKKGRSRVLVVGKTYANGRAEQLAPIHQRLNNQLSWHSNRRVRVPSILGQFPDLHMALLCDARGQSPGHGVRWTTREIRAVAFALAALHRSRVEGISTFSMADERKVVLRWHALLGRILPADVENTQGLVGRLLHASEQIDATTQCMVHRDFYDRQLIIGRCSTTLLDLDTLAMGHPCLDLGNLLAHVFFAGLYVADDPRGGRRHDVGEFEALSVALIRCYEASGGPIVDRQALSFYFASALFRVAAVHALRTRTRARAPAMWQAAADALSHVDGTDGVSAYRFLASRRLTACQTFTARRITKPFSHQKKTECRSVP